MTKTQCLTRFDTKDERMERYARTSNTQRYRQWQFTRFYRLMNHVFLLSDTLIQLRCSYRPHEANTIIKHDMIMIC
jgi:hypothetical protein